MGLMSAVHRAFALGTFPNTTTVVVTFLGQAVCPICRLVIYFYGAILKEVFQTPSADVHNL
jgi:hypothetical protein